MDDRFKYNEHVAGIVERLRHEPALRGWVLTAPTRALAALRVSLDDDQLVQLLEQIEAMDQRSVHVTARDVMTSDVMTTTTESTTHEAADVLVANRISGLPVRGPDGSIVGMLSVYDLLAKSGSTVGEVMSHQVTTVSETTPISKVRAVLVSQNLRRVPVIDAQSRLVGIISLGDLVRELAYRWST